MRAVASRPSLYEKLLVAYNQMSGFETRKLGDQEDCIGITRFFKAKTTTACTNKIAAFAGSIPLYTSRMNVDHLIGRRTKIGELPEYSEIEDINKERYDFLSGMNTTTDEFFQQLQKYRYKDTFRHLDYEGLITHWKMQRDQLNKVNNVKREFGIPVRELENKSNHKQTLRAGGQNMRSKQLEIIRQICSNLQVSTLHGNDQHVLQEDLFQTTLEQVWQRRKEVATVFDYRVQTNDKGQVNACAPRKVRQGINRNPKLFVLNRVLRSWGFSSIKKVRKVKISSGICPFTKRRDSSMSRFQDLLAKYPEYACFVQSKDTKYRHQRIAVIGELRKRQRQNNVRRQEHQHVINVSKGDLFKNAFKVEWTNKLKNTISISKQALSHSVNPWSLSAVHILSLCNLDQSSWDAHAESFFLEILLAINKEFWEG